MKPVHLFAICACAAALVALWAFESHTHETPPSVASPNATAMSPVSAASQAGRGVTAPPPNIVASTVTSSNSKAALVDALSKTGRPKDASKAYQLLHKCVDARNDQLIAADRAAWGDKRPPADIAAGCGDLSPGQIASRRQLLDKAAIAGVHGAAQAVAYEGPHGMGVEPSGEADDPDEVAYTAATIEAIEVGAEHGDVWSLMAMSTRSEVPPPGAGSPDYAAALTYAVAANDAYKRDHGTDQRIYERELTRLKSKVEPRQAEAAIEDGHKLSIKSSSVR